MEIKKSSIVSSDDSDQLAYLLNIVKEPHVCLFDKLRHKEGPREQPEFSWSHILPIPGFEVIKLFSC